MRQDEIEHPDEEGRALRLPAKLVGLKAGDIEEPLHQVGIASEEGQRIDPDRLRVLGCWLVPEHVRRLRCLVVGGRMTEPGQRGKVVRLTRRHASRTDKRYERRADPSMHYPTTPDGRYFVVRGRLWRMSNPALREEQRQELVAQLMAARRQVGIALKQSNEAAEREARSRVDAAKIALGERGPVWWTDEAPDYNRHLVKNTPYAVWHAALSARESVRGEV